MRTFLCDETIVEGNNWSGSFLFFLPLTVHQFDVVPYSGPVRCGMLQGAIKKQL